MLEVFQFIGRVEVAHINLPVMLIAVRVVNRSRSWYESRDGIVTYDECCPAAMPPDTPR